MSVTKEGAKKRSKQMKQLHNLQINCLTSNFRFVGEKNCNLITNCRVQSDTIVQCYEFVKRLGQEIDEANKTNKELLDHKNMSNYLEGLGKQKCGAWSDWAYAYSGGSASTVSDNSIQGFPTGKAKKWYDAAYQKYIELGSPEGSTDKDFEKWCAKKNDLNKIDPKDDNYNFIKDSLKVSN